MQQSRVFEEVIPSDTSAAQDVQERIILSLEEFGYSPRDIFCMRLAIEEAIVNAIKHGNKYDPSKNVVIRGEIDAIRIRLEIEDEGAGFRLEDVPDPTADENLHKASGRGIKLMQSFLTSITYNGVGNRVTLVKHREPAEDAG
jgi:serine/threonine-protein kinase RsbW